MASLRIVAEMIFKPGCRDELLPVLQALVTGSRAEPGNREYDLTVSLDNPDQLFVIETWASEEAVAEHNQSPHFLAFAAAVAGKTERRVAVKVRPFL